MTRVALAILLPGWQWEMAAEAKGARAPRAIALLCENPLRDFKYLQLYCLPPTPVPGFPTLPVL